MYKAILCASHLSIFACVAMYTLCQEFISGLLLKSLPPFLFSAFFNKLAVYVSVTLPYAYMCNGHHAYGLVALLMLFACLHCWLYCPYNKRVTGKFIPCALVTGDFS